MTLAGETVGDTAIGVTAAVSSCVWNMPTDAPTQLRGTFWATSPQPSLVHRSPSIEGAGVTCRFLVIYPIFDPLEGT